MVAIGAVSLVAVRPAAPLHAWGGAGHHVIVRIALSQMTPDARRLVHDLLGDEDAIDASTWADRVRGDRPATYNWHFVNVPIGERAYVATRDCPATDSGDCVVAEIARARTETRDRTRSRESRAESLKFLLHFVGDMHQPLHTIGNRDRGGNDVSTVVDGYAPAPGRGQPNLHSVWDSVLIGRRGLDETALADLLIARLRAEPLDDPDVIDVEAWAMEAHELARRFVYAYPGFSTEGPRQAPVRLDLTYQRVAEPIIDRQLQRAGIRLARILNDLAK